MCRVCYIVYKNDGPTNSCRACSRHATTSPWPFFLARTKGELSSCTQNQMYTSNEKNINYSWLVKIYNIVYTCELIFSDCCLFVVHHLCRRDRLSRPRVFVRLLHLPCWMHQEASINHKTNLKLFIIESEIFQVMPVFVFRSLFRFLINKIWYNMLRQSTNNRPFFITQYLVSL